MKTKIMKPTLLIPVLVGVLLAMIASAADIQPMKQFVNTLFPPSADYEKGAIEAMNSWMLHDLYLKMTDSDEINAKRGLFVAEQLRIKPDPSWVKAVDEAGAGATKKRSIADAFKTEPTVSWTGQRLVTGKWTEVDDEPLSSVILTNVDNAFMNWSPAKKEPAKKTRWIWGIAVRDLELGLRSDGVVIWREAKP